MPINPYQPDPDKPPRLRDSVVVFLDALGSKEWARAEMPIVEQRMLTFYEAWSEAENLFETALDSMDSWRHITFSDNVFFGFPIPPESDGHEAYVLAVNITALYQFALAYHGVFTRGSMTRGVVTMSDAFAFGEGLERSSELEKTAIEARVVIDEPLLSFHSSEYRQAHTAHEVRYIDAIDAPDGKRMVNYLSAAHDSYRARQLLEEHASHICNQLARKDTADSVIAKYRWLAGYHSQFVATDFPSEPSLRLPCDAPQNDWAEQR